jgi:Zn-dependent protease with chaperone function
MNREEVEAVIGHEVAHVANGDMVTLTLIQGVMNTFVVFLSRASSVTCRRQAWCCATPAAGRASATIITTIVHRPGAGRARCD